MTRFTEIICWPFQRKPRMLATDLDVFNADGRRAVYLLVGCSLFLGTPANGGGGGEAA